MPEFYKRNEWYNQKFELLLKLGILEKTTTNYRLERSNCTDNSKQKEVEEFNTKLKAFLLQNFENNNELVDLILQNKEKLLKDDLIRSSN